MRAFGAITIKILTIVTVLFNSIVKHFFGLAYLLANFGQIGKLKGGTIFIYERLNINAIKLQAIIIYIKILLRKVERLMNEVGISIIHLLEKRKRLIIKL